MGGAQSNEGEIAGKQMEQRRSADRGWYGGSEQRGARGSSTKQAFRSVAAGNKKKMPTQCFDIVGKCVFSKMCFSKLGTKIVQRFCA